MFVHVHYYTLLYIHVHVLIIITETTVLFHTTQVWEYILLQKWILTLSAFTKKHLHKPNYYMYIPTNDHKASQYMYIHVQYMYLHVHVLYMYIHVQYMYLHVHVHVSTCAMHVC